MSQIMPDEHSPREEMTSFQLLKLQQTLAHAGNNSDFYKRLFHEHGVNPQDIDSLDKISKLPFTKKSDLVDNYPYGMCAVKPSEIIRLHSSSGTTGKPINTYYTANDQENWRKCMERNCRTAGITKEDVCQIAFRYTLFTGAFGHHLGAESCGAMVIPTSSGQTERQIMMMQDLQTTVLHCTPSYALVIAERLKQLGISRDSLSLRLGIHGAEKMTEEMRRHIEEDLGVTALGDYGLTEFGGPGVSIECLNKEGFHINEDFFYPEIIDPNTLEPLPAGSIGELVITSLQKEAMPIIRYRTRDVTYLTYDECSCGRTLVRHGPILGRTDDMLNIGGVNFFPSQLESILLGFTEAAPHYALRLSKKGPLDQVTVDLETTPEFWNQLSESASERLSARIEAKIKDILGFRIKIHLKSPNSVPRFEGKSKRVFDER